MQNRVRLGISTCLLGENVRYNGGHKYDPFLVETLGQFVEYVPVCPEVECGFGVPRESMRLVGDPAAPRLITHNTKRDLTDVMTAWARQRVTELEKENLCGFIFKAKSPSSGMERVKVYTAGGGMAGHGVGLFARAFMDRFPLLPVEEEGRLHDPDLRENFIERVFALNRYRDAMTSDPTPRGLMEYHRRHKLLIMAHSPDHVRTLGKLTAGSQKRGFKDTRTRYEAGLLEALGLKATVRKHVNVLQHMLGYFKERIDSDEKKELLAIIEEFRREQVPLIVPVTLLAHFVRKYKVEYLADQHYLAPHPLELKLRNHA